jgi:hypothetical protein
MKTAWIATFVCLVAVAVTGQEIEKSKIKVTASSWEQKAHSGFADFPPEMTLDGKLDTSWRAEGKGQWIQCDLGEVKRLREVRIAFVSGDKRSYTIDILVSQTGGEKEWTPVIEKAVSSGKTTELESFKLNGAEARYVRIVGQGNTSDKFPNWINITEVLFVAQGTEAAKVLYAQPFSEETMKAWTTIAGKWGLIVEDQKTYYRSEPAGARVVVGDKAWTDYTVEVRARVNQWTSEALGDYGIIARYVDPNNYYLFLYDHNPKVKALIIQKKVAGKLITIAQQPLEYEIGRWYTLRGVVTGDTLDFYLDGQKMLTATATEFKSGPAGLLTWLADVRYDAFKVTTSAQ